MADRFPCSLNGQWDQVGRHCAIDTDAGVRIRYEGVVKPDTTGSSREPVLF